MIRDDYDSVTHESCEKCGSNDNKAVYHYSDGSTSWHCFTPGCNNHKTSGDVNIKALDMSRFSLFTKGIPSRGLTVEALNHYQVQYSTKKGKPEIAFPYYKEHDFPIGAKVRDKDKNFWWEGSAKEPWLFGRWFIPDRRRKYLIITEGEFDAVAAYQMTDYAVVSLPNGAAAAARDIKNNLKWVEEFEKVIICFDNDEAGNKAADEVMDIIVAGKAYKTRLRYKDACEYTKLGEKGVVEFKADLESARCRETNTLVPKDELINACYEYLERTDDEINGLSTGFPDVDKWWRIRPEEVTTIFSDPSVGKSSFARQIIANYTMQYEGNVLYFAFEESYIRYFMKSLDMTLDGEFTRQREAIEGFAERVISANINSFDLKRISEAIEYAVRGKDVSLVVFDNITACCSGCSDYQEAVRSLLSLLVSLGKQHKHSTIVISHTKRDGNLKAGTPPLVNAAFGSSGIEQFSDNIISFGREEGVDELWFAVRKQRENGLVGVSEKPLRYNKEKRCFSGIKLDRRNQENDEDSRQETNHKAREFTFRDESPRQDRASDTVRGVSRRHDDTGKVRQQNGTKSPRGSGGIFQRRTESQSYSKRSSSVRRKRHSDSELQSRLRDYPPQWEKTMDRMQRTFERYRQDETPKLADISERGDAYYGLRESYPYYAPSEDNDLFRLG